MGLPALSVPATKDVTEASLRPLLLRRQVRTQVVMNDDPVGERFEPHLAAADQDAADRPANSLVASVHEDRELEIRPPQPPAMLLVEETGEYCRITHDEGLVDEVDQGHGCRMPPNRPR